MVDLAQDGTKVLLTFLSIAPEEVEVADIQKYVVAPEKLIVIGKEAYLYCPDGYGTSKLSNMFIERKFRVEATTRNWKTIAKLFELSR